MFPFLLLFECIYRIFSSICNDYRVIENVINHLTLEYLKKYILFNDESSTADLMILIYDAKSFEHFQ